MEAARAAAAAPAGESLPLSVRCESLALPNGEETLHVQLVQLSSQWLVWVGAGASPGLDSLHAAMPPPSRRSPASAAATGAATTLLAGPGGDARRGGEDLARRLGEYRLAQLPGSW